MRAPFRSEVVNFGSYIRLSTWVMDCWMKRSTMVGIPSACSCIHLWISLPSLRDSDGTPNRLSVISSLCSRRYDSSWSTPILSIPPLTLLALTWLYDLLRLSGVRMHSTILSDDRMHFYVFISNYPNQDRRSLISFSWCAILPWGCFLMFSAFLLSSGKIKFCSCG